MIVKFRASRRSGFSLIQLSILLTVGGLLLAATLPGGEAGSESAKTRITLERMTAIEDATQAYMAANQRRPYPADLTAAFGSAAFGVELAVPTDYSSVPTTHFTSTLWTLSSTRTAGASQMTVSNNAGVIKNMLVSGTGINTGTWVDGINSSTSFYLNKPASATGSGTVYVRDPLVTGGVPTKTLGLPDEYAIDGFGHRIMYMVDARVATTAGCAALQNNNRQGALALSNSATFSSGTYDSTMWALMSYGKDGFGGYGMQGSALTTRLKNNNGDTATLANAFMNASQVNSYYPYGLITSAASPFDDIVWVNQLTKNTCAMGRTGATLANSFRDFRISGGGNADTNATAAAFGDINGDGIKDIILGVPQQNLVRVIFGKKDGWPDPTNAYDTTALDGTNGFTITRGATNYMTNFGSSITIGDFNGDGYDDILIGGTPPAITDYADAVVFGGPSFASSVDASALTATQGFRIKGLNTSVTAFTSAGDVNGDGYDDITLPYNPASYDTGVATDHYATFDGTDDYVTTSASSALAVGSNMTACIWVNFTSLTAGTKQIMGTEASGSSYASGFLLSQVNSDLNIYYKSAGGVKTHSAQLTTGWHHICITNSAGTMQTYYDGSAIPGTYAAGGSIVSTTLKIGMGGYTWPTITGKLADARIYNTALSASNITYIFSNGSSGVDPGTANLVGRWQFNEGTGTVVSDSSGNRIHGFAANITESSFWPAANFNIGQGVIYGKASSWANIDLVAKYLNGTNGFYFYTATPDASSGMLSYGTTDATVFNRQLTAICDIDGDGIGDLFFPAAYSTAVITPQRMYVVRGRSTANWSAIATAGQITPGGVGLKYRFYNADTATPAYNLQGAACKDINSDGYDDLLFYLKSTSSSQEYVYSYFGRANASLGNVSMDTAYDIRWDMLASAPTGTNTSAPYIFSFGDLNNDGKNDIILSRSVNAPNVTSSGSTFTINNTAIGTVRSNAGEAFVLYQPSTCPYTSGVTCWGGSTALAINFFSTYTLTGTDGFKIAGAVANDYASVLGVTDMNKDGKDDILLGSGVNPTGAYFLFGKTTWPGSYDPNCMRDNSGTHCPVQMFLK